jgi:Flp pilus assembly protein TadD
MTSDFPFHWMSRRRTRRSAVSAIALLAGLAACTNDPMTDSIRSRPIADSPGSPTDRVTPILRVAQATERGGDLRSAVGLYRRAHSMEPHRYEPVIGLADALARLGAADEAAEAYRTALNIRPRDAAALRGLGNQLLALGQPAQGIVQLEAALDQGPDARLFNSLGVAHDVQGDHAAAQAYYRAGLDIEPASMALRANLALSFILAGQYNEAIEILKPMALGSAATPRLRQNLALAYGLSGDMDSAARVSRVDLDEAAVRHNLAYYSTLRAVPDRRVILRALRENGAFGGAE